MLVTQTTKNAFFFEKFYRGHDPPHPRRCLYTPPVETPAHSSAPGTAAHNKRQGRPCQMQAQTMQDTAHRSALNTRQAAAGRSYRRRTGSVSDRARPNGQNYCKQKYSFFMRKPLDKRNKIVYNIDSKQTYLHHHKTGGQKP